LILLEAPKN